MQKSSAKRCTSYRQICVGWFPVSERNSLMVQRKLYNIVKRKFIWNYCNFCQKWKLHFYKSVKIIIGYTYIPTFMCYVYYMYICLLIILSHFGIIYLNASDKVLKDHNCTCNSTICTTVSDSRCSVLFVLVEIQNGLGRAYYRCRHKAPAKLLKQK